VLRRLAPIVAVLLLLAACSDDSSSSADPTTDDSAQGREGPDTDTAFPGETWAVTTPAEAGLDAAPLEELATQLGEVNSSCLTVVRDGEVVFEEGWLGADPETDDEIWSATKSMTSTLVGIAQEEGLLEIDEPVANYVEEWVGTESEDVTVRNLLSNDSGRYYDFQNDYVAMAIGADDKTAFAIGLEQQHPVGEHWEYNNSAIQVLEQVLEEATGQDVAEYAQEHLFTPIGMTSEMTHDDAGNTLAFMGAKASCHDLARFGHLFLNEGSWDGEQVVPAEWVAQATSPSQEVNPDYGFLWWLYPEGAVAVDADVPTPPPAYAALGLGGQIVLVVPEDDLVVVRMGPASQSDGGGQGALISNMLGLGHQAVVEGAG
jgi:CubicO group peptidase (beta-lactamase class C family)